MEKRELIAMLMESPFYFDLHLRERLGLLRHHQRRFSINGPTGHPALPDQEVPIIIAPPHPAKF